MDLRDWEMLSVDGLLDFHDDGEGKVFSRRRSTYSDSFVDANHFKCPSPEPWKLVDSPGNSEVPNKIVPVAVQLESRTVKEPDPDDELVKDIAKLAGDECGVKEKVKAPNIKEVEDPDQRSQVFFKKLKENEFVDMKMDSPMSYGGVRGFVPTIDAFFFEEKCEGKKKKNMVSDVNWEEGEDDTKGGPNVWKWGLTGVGALCSFGLAAATFCLLVLGSRQSDKQNQSFRFQIYADEKRIKQVVHHATKLNEAISAARGVPLTGAHITFGGYYDGL